MFYLEHFEGGEGTYFVGVKSAEKRKKGSHNKGEETEEPDLIKRKDFFLLLEKLSLVGGSLLRILIKKGKGEGSFVTAEKEKQEDRK